jgi:polysaccharide export outer membrane protein
MRQGLLFAGLLLPLLFASASLSAQGAAATKSDQKTDERGAAQARPEEKSNLGAPVDPASFVLGPEDIITIRVWHENDVSGEFAIRPDGKITMALIGEVVAGGLTPKQLTQSVTERLSKFINSPEVLISVREVRSRKYLVSGEVGRPGSYPLVTRITVVEALVNAGGFREFANKKKIVIIRGSQRIKFNYNDVIKGKGDNQNLAVESGDHIVVP